MTNTLRAIPLLLLAGGLCASAAVVMTSSYTAGNQAAYPVSNSDLIEGNSGVITAGYLNYGTLGNLTNGLVGGNNNTGDTAIGEVPWAVTYTLDTLLTPQGYNITGINTFTAWADLRTNQNYTVTYTVVGTPTVQTLGTFANGDTASGGGSLKIALTDNSPGSVLIAGAKTLTFAFTPMPFGDPAVVGSAYREIDVFGGAVIPEPTMLGLLVLGGAALLRRRRA